MTQLPRDRSGVLIKYREHDHLGARMRKGPRKRWREVRVISHSLFGSEWLTALFKSKALRWWIGRKRLILHSKGPEALHSKKPLHMYPHVRLIAQEEKKPRLQPRSKGILFSLPSTVQRAPVEAPWRSQNYAAQVTCIRKSSWSLATLPLDSASNLSFQSSPGVLSLC